MGTITNYYNQKLNEDFNYTLPLIPLFYFIYQISFLVYFNLQIIFTNYYLCIVEFVCPLIESLIFINL